MKCMVFFSLPVYMKKTFLKDRSVGLNKYQYKDSLRISVHLNEQKHSYIWYRRGKVVLLGLLSFALAILLIIVFTHFYVSAKPPSFSSLPLTLYSIFLILERLKYGIYESIVNSRWLHISSLYFSSPCRYN